MAEIYYLGGAPCSGKTTAASALRARHGLRAFDLDRHLERLTHRGMLDGNKLLRWASITPPEDTWRRPVAEQSYAEWAIYRAVFPYIRQELEALGEGAPILAEGTGLLPESLAEAHVAPDHCLFLVPSPDFQRVHFRQRPWVAQVLAHVEHPEEAFSVWMARNDRFATAIRQQAQQLGYTVLETDESSSEAATLRMVEQALGLAKGKA